MLGHTRRLFFFMIFVLSLGEDDDENDGMR